MKFFKLLSILVTLTLINGCDIMTNKDKPTIVLTAFGTSVPEARKVFKYIDSKTKERYAGYDVRWAYTSSFIRKKLKIQGIVTYSLSEVVEELRGQGVSDIVVQSLHVVPGQEFKEISQVNTDGLNVSVGDALLTTDNDIDLAIKAVQGDIKSDCPNILAGHGNDRHPEFNKQLIAFDDELKKRFDNVRLCTVEGSPGIKSLEKLKGSNLASINFIPLMIVAGDHIMNDVMGDEDDSWKSIVGARETSFTKPLGYNDKILEIYFQHMDKALGQLVK